MLDVAASGGTGDAMYIQDVDMASDDCKALTRWH
jgi:hypothetical protein